MPKQTKFTIPLTSMPSKSPMKKLPSHMQRPTTQPNGKRLNIAITSNTNDNMMMGALQALNALKQTVPQPLMEQGDNSELAKMIAEKQLPFPPIVAAASSSTAVSEQEKAMELMKLSDEHEKLIDVILEEEDQLIDAHKRHIDAVMELAKKEMSLLQEVSKPGSDIEDYVKGLNAILEHKLEIISVLRSRLLGFYYHIRQEEDICKKVNEQQQLLPPDKKADADTDLLQEGIHLDDFDFDHPNIN